MPQTQKIPCQFEFDSCCSKLYACRIQNQKFPRKITSETFVGTHDLGKTNVHVEELIISHSNLPNILQGMGDAFANIKKLHIFSSNLGNISKFDLKQFPNLEKISLVNNPIEYLPGDLFEFTPKVQNVSASPNIKFIGEKLLDGLELTRVDFCGNKSINDFYNSNNEKTSLKVIKSEIKLKCQPPSELIENIEVFKIGGGDEIPDKSGRATITKFPEKFGILELLGNPSHNSLNIVSIPESSDDIESPDFITIKVGSKVFKVDKNLLIKRSQIFAEIFDKNENLKFLTVDDIPVEIFEEVLRFMNTEELPKLLPIKAEKASEIFDAASKLKIEGLKKKCEEILVNEKNFEDNLSFSIKLLNLGVKHENENLKLKVLEELKKHFPGKKLKAELLGQPEKLKKLILTKKSLDEQLKEIEDV